jgi:hypothetical protein
MAGPSPDLSGLVDTQIGDAADFTTPFNDLDTWLTDWNEGVNGTDRVKFTEESVTISSGGISPTKTNIIVDTEGAASTDDLTTINNNAAGRYHILRIANAARSVVLKHGTGNIRIPGAADLTISDTDTVIELVYNGSNWIVVTGISVQPGTPGIFQGRVTLTSATPITTTDVTAATSVYVTPFRGNRISLYNSTSGRWDEYSFSEITLSLSGKAADTNYDVFVYISGGSVTGELVAWSNATTRATALTTQSGVYVKNGATDRLYVGTIRTTATIGQCEDSKTKRYVWNYYNRVRKNFYFIEATNSWTYATNTWRSLNNTTANRVEFVIGVAEELVNMSLRISASGSVNGVVGWGLDSTSSPSGLFPSMATNSLNVLSAEYKEVVAVGYHYLQALENAQGATITFYGDVGVAYVQSGAYGDIAA